MTTEPTNGELSATVWKSGKPVLTCTNTIHPLPSAPPKASVSAGQRVSCGFHGQHKTARQGVFGLTQEKGVLDCPPPKKTAPDLRKHQNGRTVLRRPRKTARKAFITAGQRVSCAVPYYVGRGGYPTATPSQRPVGRPVGSGR